MFFADMHTHSEHSHDSECKIEDMCLSQREKGTSVFAVTDHCDIGFSDKIDVFSPLQECFDEIQTLNQKYNGMILSGIEIGEGFWFPETCKKIHNFLPYDVIIGSVHCVRSKNTCQSYSSLDFSLYTQEDIYDYLDCYFNDMLTMLNFLDFDILAHLTCPLRYISGRYGRKVDMSRFDEKINLILETIINHSIALEVNTSKYYEITHEFSPNSDIIKRYKDMGGYLITLASDAHVSERASIYFTEVVRALKEIGFENAFYYKNRKPIPYAL